MKVLTIGKGLIGDDGKVVTGQTISSLDPDKIVYTGGVPSEEEIVKKWAAKGKREYGSSFKKEPIKEPVKKVTAKETYDDSEPTVDVMFPEEKSDKSKNVNPLFVTYK
ncbi:MAG: hypothetical protein WC877_01045 [Dehalococcoidales bacterium]|jgi:hypothetical protein